MHQAALQWVERCAPLLPGDVLDVGGRDVNGTPRHLFELASSFRTVDLRPGPNVDVVGDICQLGLVAVADTVLCLEVLEHAENWTQIVAACARALRPGGCLIVTCAGPGRPEHSAVDGNELRDGEWYRNVSCGDLSDAIERAGLMAMVDREGHDTRGFGRLL